MIYAPSDMTLGDLLLCMHEVCCWGKKCLIIHDVQFAAVFFLVCLWHIRVTYYCIIIHTLPKKYLQNLKHGKEHLNIGVKAMVLIYKNMHRHLGTDHLTWRGGGYVFFSKKIFRFPMLLKKIFWFWWRKKKKNLIQSFCHIT
jgi:hypothetical protein